MSTVVLRMQPIQCLLACSSTLPNDVFAFGCVLMHGHHFRITGDGILPLRQSLIDIQADVLATHCPLFEYEGRAFLVTGSAPTQYSYMKLMQLKGLSASLTTDQLP